MSKHQTIKMIRAEIARLNQEIDLCIIKGVSYRHEAHRHKFLTAQLSRLSPNRSSWISSLSFITSFLF